MPKVGAGLPVIVDDLMIQDAVQIGAQGLPDLDLLSFDPEPGKNILYNILADLFDPCLIMSFYQELPGIPVIDHIKGMLITLPEQGKQ